MSTVLPPSARAAASALAAGLFYGAFDLVGQKFLWWTWHDTDAAVAIRWLGVPVGSTLWTLVHVFVLVRLALVLAPRPLPPFRAAVALATVTIITTPLMMVVMALLQMHQLRLSIDNDSSDGAGSWGLPVLTVTQRPGRPDYLSLALALATLTCLLLRGVRRARDGLAVRQDGQGEQDDRSKARAQAAVSPTPTGLRLPSSGTRVGMLLAVALYHIVLVSIMALGDPAQVRAVGIHQELGPCGVKATDLGGYSRDVYLCAARFDEDFRVCDTLPETADAPVAWYALCGQPHGNAVQAVAFTAALGLVSVIFYAWLLFGCVDTSTKAAKTQRYTR